MPDTAAIVNTASLVRVLSDIRSHALEAVGGFAEGAPDRDVVAAQERVIGGLSGLIFQLEQDATRPIGPRRMSPEDALGRGCRQVEQAVASRAAESVGYFFRTGEPWFQAPEAVRDAA